jgi:glycolate oxidase FAD binding subunit
VDGSAQLLRFGGKVVKNAAEFDLPKLLVGGMGRLSVLVEAIFKFFPLSKSSVTIVLAPLAHEDTMKALVSLGTSRWEIVALEVLPNQKSIIMRLRGLASAISSLAREILVRWNGRQVPDDEADEM